MHTLWKFTKKLLKYASLLILALVLALVLAGTAYRTYRQYQIEAATAIDPARGIEEEGFVRIGGIEQWIVVRGVDRRNPVLLLLHGGPGLPSSVNPKTLLHDLEQRYTVVQWDQRGAGKTWGRSGPVESAVTIERMVQDGIEVAEYLQRHLQQPKIVLMGHSWGALLGVYMAKARPELFWACVGTGQLSDYDRDRKAAYDLLLAEARARNDREAVTELAAIGPPPWQSTLDASINTKWANAFEGDSSPWELIGAVLFDSPKGIFDIPNFMGGMMSSQDHFRDAVNAVNLASLGNEFAVPMFVFQGAKDYVTPASSAESWLAGIQAPQKAFAAIEGAGHNAYLERSERFVELLDEYVRPLIPAQP